MSPDSFIDALRPHYDDALRYCRLLCADWDVTATEDVLQQALLQALEKYGDLRDPSKFRAWLFKILFRTYLKAKRKHFWNRFIPLDLDTTVPKLPAVYERPEGSEDTALLFDALSVLSPKERAAFLLFEVGGFSIEEIRQMQQERSPSTIKMRLKRAREKLRAHLQHAASHARATRRSLDGTGSIEHETLNIISELNGGRTG